MFDIIGTKAMNGYVLNQPNIEINNRKMVKTNNGQFRLLEPILNPFSFEDVYFIYSDDGNNDYDYN
jgi:hypothetical protein